MSTQPASKRDRFVSGEVTNTLFPGIDLVARNIQRGRDHGLPGYNEFRDYCGMNRICSWNDIPKVYRESDIHSFANKNTVNTLISVLSLSLIILTSSDKNSTFITVFLL